MIKLASGITSENVALLRGPDDARYWTRRLFEHGSVTLERERLVPRPRRMARRLLNAARVVATGALPPIGTRTDLQKGYLLVQEFLEGNTIDTRITVIGNRAFAFRRLNRPDDFRASGSGRIDWDPAAIAEDAVALAFRVARRLGSQSLAVDVLRKNGAPVINEIIYCYEGWAVEACPGHWRVSTAGQIEWVEGHLAPERAILHDFLQRVCRG